MSGTHSAGRRRRANSGSTPPPPPAIDIATQPRVPAQRGRRVRPVPVPALIDAESTSTLTTDSVPATPPPPPALAQPPKYKSAPAKREIPVPRQRHAVQIPLQAEWVEKQRGRALVRFLMALAVGVALACLAVALWLSNPIWVVGMALAGLVAAVIRGALISSAPTLVRLHGSNLTITKGSNHYIFDLTDTFHLVETVGEPGDAGWRLRLEDLNGHIHELTANQVDAEVMHAAIPVFRSAERRGGASAPKWWMMRD